MSDVERGEMVRQAMTLKRQALLAFVAGYQQGNRQVRSCPTVIPAQAGIQCKYAVHSTQHNDGNATFGTFAAMHSAEMPA
jgi:hypothetical protein